MVVTQQSAKNKGERMQKIIQLFLTVVADKDGRGTQQPTEYKENVNNERMRRSGADGDNSKNTTIIQSGDDIIFCCAVFYVLVISIKH